MVVDESIPDESGEGCTIIREKKIVSGLLSQPRVTSHIVSRVDAVGHALLRGPPFLS